MKSLLAAGCIALSLSGAAFAQEASITTQSTTTTTAPAQGDYSASKTERSVDSAGNESVKHKSYESGPNGTAQSSMEKSKSADGSEAERHKQVTTTPDGSTSSETTERKTDPQN